MRYRLVAEVDGDVFLDNVSSAVHVTGFGYSVEFIPDESHRLVKIAVSTSVSAEEFGVAIRPGDDATPTIEVRRGEETHRLLVQVLQEIESHLSFNSGGSLRGLDWSAPTAQWEPETDEESALSLDMAIRQKMEYPRPAARLTPEDLVPFVLAHRTHSDLVLSKAFWREALNEYTARRFIQAYYNFYFILEEHYANGKTSEREVIRAFAASSNFSQDIEHALEQMRAEPRHWTPLSQLYAAEACTLDVAGTHQFLFHMRGKLHHVSRGNKRLQPNPFHQDELESVALLGMRLATITILRQDGGLPHVKPGGQPPRS